MSAREHDASAFVAIAALRKEMRENAGWTCDGDRLARSEAADRRGRWKRQVTC